jgi:hypothetical protein
MVDRRGLQKKRPKMEKRKNEMKERQPDVNRKKDTKGMPKKEQVPISRFRIG